ncbi:hypothetical protein AN480_04310 [Mycobacterium intracellulare subsp. chimaera]|nr:hypothetical protein AN480_04310 [Mycobacterium intracellulare subsp. chimaera]
MITKHSGTGGLVSVGTVAAQLLYKIAEPAYLGPRRVTHFDTIRLAQQGEHRVAISGTKGSPPPDTLKVASSTRPGAQAKGRGEYVRSRVVDVPESLLDTR